MNGEQWAWDCEEEDCGAGTDFSCSTGFRGPKGSRTKTKSAATNHMKHKHGGKGKEPRIYKVAS